MRPRDDEAVRPDHLSASEEVIHTEETPLLPTDLPPEVAPSKAIKRLVVVLMFLLFAVVMTGDYIMEAPRQQIMEEVICRRRFRDHQKQPGFDDPRCKNNDVQKTLAMVRTWLFSMQSIVPLAVQLPFGIMADKYGRSWILCLSLSGAVLENLWEFAILHWSDHFESIWPILYGNIFFLLGGGVPMILAMAFTILSDVVPAAERGRIFYSLEAMTLVLAVVVHPWSALLMDINPWIPMWIGFGLILSVTIMSAFFPETLKYRQRADEQMHGGEPGPSNPLDRLPGKDVDSGPFKHAWASAKASAVHMWTFLFRSKMTMMLIVAYGLYYPVRVSLSMIVLQYMSKRFNMSWQTATYCLTVCNLATAVFFLVGLPSISAGLTRYFHLGPVSRDLKLNRILSIVLLLSSVVLSFADVPWLYILALVFATFGSGMSTLMRGLLSSVVEPHTVATLFTTLGFAESINGFWGPPFMGWLQGKGMEIGGAWSGLPYMVWVVLMALVTGALFAYRPPREVVEAEEAAQEGR